MMPKADLMLWRLNKFVNFLLYITDHLISLDQVILSHAYGSFHPVDVRVHNCCLPVHYKPSLLTQKTAYFILSCR